jgi:chorismate mutase/prephenate dehydrogenase
MDNEETTGRLLSEMRRIDDKIMSLVGERLRISSEIGLIGEECPDTGFSVLERFRALGDMVGMNRTAAEELCRIITEQSSAAESLSKHKEQTKKNIAVVGGSGQMGKAIVRLFREMGHEVTVIDPAAGNGLTTEDAKDSDAVAIAVPISSVSKILEELDAVCREDTLIFDISSLKTPFVENLKKLAKRRKVCSVHPMFGPSVRSIHGRNLIVCDCGSEAAVNQAKGLFDGRGAEIKIIPVDKHDEYMSYVLGLSHIVNIVFFTVLRNSGIPFEEFRSLSSTTFDKMTDTFMSVALEDPSLYYEIQNLNMNRDRMLHELDEGIRQVSEAAASDDSKAFEELMLEGKEYLKV